MKKNDMLFVYGTLRKGERADLTKNAKKFSVTDLGLDKINGKLYHLGGFPGLKLLEDTDPEIFDENAPTVIGGAFLVLDSSIGAILDSYEGYRANAPKQGLYDRTQVMSGLGRLVWVYTYNGMVTQDQLIETGDWKNPRLCISHRFPTLS